MILFTLKRETSFTVCFMLMSTKLGCENVLRVSPYVPECNAQERGLPKYLSTNNFTELISLFY